MNLNLTLIKQLSVLSVFIGIVGGILALFPIFTLLIFLLSFVLPAILILIYLKRNNLLEFTTPKDGCLHGAIIGFVSFLALFTVYTPLSVLIGWVLGKFHIMYAPGFMRFIPFDFGSIILLIISIIFSACMSALFNGFVGIVITFVDKFISTLKITKTSNSPIDIKSNPNFYNNLKR